MASVSEDDAASERCCGSYSPNADVSESETSSDCSAPTASTRRFASSSSATVSRLAFSSSSLPTPASAAAFYLSKPASDLSEVDMMKERFAKLLLGEDMYGSGKGDMLAFHSLDWD